MANEATFELASLRFDGKRFGGHALDVECTQELIAYRSLILECAKELWRRKNPGRVRLPRRFEEGFRVTRARGSSIEAAYTPKARARLAEWVGPTYEDKVDLVGEVRMANLGPGAFRLQIAETGVQVEGRFDATEEALVLDALTNHRSVRLRVKGIAEFSTPTIRCRRLQKVRTLGHSAYDPAAAGYSYPTHLHRLPAAPPRNRRSRAKR
jgi:hypothetical protein